MTFDKHMRYRALFLTDNFIGDGSLNQAFIYVAARLLISVGTVYNWFHERDCTGRVAPGRVRNGDGQVIMPQAHAAFLVNHLTTVDCQLYVTEMKDLLSHEFGGRTYSCKQIEDALKRNNFTSKQVELIAAEQDGVERQAFRYMMRRQSEGSLFSPEMFLFCDETHMNVKQARRKFGWALRGKPAFQRRYKSKGLSESFSCICTMGITGIKTVTPYEEGVNATVFMDTLENIILPAMGIIGEPFSVLVLDNASPHDKIAIRALVELHGRTVLFLPPYSYDFNPIELCFHVGKAMLRKLFHTDDLNVVLSGQFVDCMYQCCTAEIACNLFEHCHIYVPPEIREWAMA